MLQNQILQTKLYYDSIVDLWFKFWWKSTKEVLRLVQDEKKGIFMFLWWKISGTSTNFENLHIGEGAYRD
jgi:hypothetical protein